MLLAIDTSTDTASIALTQDGKVLAELSWHCGQNHTTQLIPQITHLLNQVGADIKAVSGVIVAKGPGSFNGLRVGTSTAKGLAFSLDIPIAGIGTLEAAAYPYAKTGLPICPIFNAGRGEIATALYQKKGNKWQQLNAEHITTVAALGAEIMTKTVFCGDYIPLIASQLRKQLRQKAVIVSPAAVLRRAGFLAELGQKRLEAGDSDKTATLQPMYLRRPSITKPRVPLKIGVGNGRMATNIN